MAADQREVGACARLSAVAPLGAFAIDDIIRTARTPQPTSSASRRVSCQMVPVSPSPVADRSYLRWVPIIAR